MFGNSIITDNKKIEELLARNVEEVIGYDSLRGKLLKGKQLRIKLGIDPTSPNIHLGRAVLLWKLRQFQDLGHKAVFIVGDFTGQIGDTSDKESERPMLSEVEIKKNMDTYFEQAHKILDKHNIETHYNSTWLKKIGFLEIGNMADKFGLHEFSTRELIKKRLDAGKRVSLRETLYPIMQGYDSVAVKADVELGGTDQRFNLLAGRTIQPIYGQASQDVVITKFPLMGLDGRKMSSSWGNVINITDEAGDMFGKVMSLNDDLIINYFELATTVPTKEIEVYKNRLEGGENPKNIKLELAAKIVALYHGEAKAGKAKEGFEKVFSKKEIPDEAETWDLKNGMDILSIMVGSGTVSSKTEGKNLIEQKGVKILDSAGETVVERWDLVVDPGKTIKVGSHKFIKVK